jgi:hypothetical protein
MYSSIKYSNLKEVAKATVPSVYVTFAHSATLYSTKRFFDSLWLGALSASDSQSFPRD